MQSASSWWSAMFWQLLCACGLCQSVACFALTISSNGSVREAGILDMLAQGAAWTPERRAAAGGLVEATCQFCGAAAGSVRHQLWQCPVILDGIGEARSEARHLEAAALAEESRDERKAGESWAAGLPPAECEIFWCRGLVPQAGPAAGGGLCGSSSGPGICPTSGKARSARRK